MRTVLVVALVSMAATAHADPVDPDTAHEASLVGAAAPVAGIVAGGFIALASSRADTRDTGLGIAAISALAGIITPSAGELYARRWLNPGMAMRLAGVAVEYAGLIKGWEADIGDCGDVTGPCTPHASTIAMLVGGAALYAGGIVLDVIQARPAARAWNRRHEMMIVPTGAGAALSLRF